MGAPQTHELMTFKEASVWATGYLQRSVTPSNIAYLVQYGRVQRLGTDKTSYVDKSELIAYYRATPTSKGLEEKLGNDLNHHLGFAHLKETDTTKHVHRLHSYKGKFIPQLVDYFLNTHTDEHKKESWFKRGDLILDPFCGSGTTLVQANELGLHTVGIDISPFNALISNVKISEVNLAVLQTAISNITEKLLIHLAGSSIPAFELALSDLLNSYNSRYFPSPDFKRWLHQKTIDELHYAEQYVPEIKRAYHALLEQFDISLRQTAKENGFLDTWFIAPIRAQIDILHHAVSAINDEHTQNVLKIILSRTVRSCRATTHADLATLKSPVVEPYYCGKHGKICRPLFSVLKWWQTYTKDTIKRLSEFSKYRTPTHQYCLTGDSREMDIQQELRTQSPALAGLIEKQKIQGIFSSPPYVGMIDYHEQHAYAYDLYDMPRYDSLEIGRMSKGQGQLARKEYVEGIAAVLSNMKPYFSDDYNIFLVANDKYDLYPSIAAQANMQIVNRYKRPVLNRVEGDKGAYCEYIFHIKNL
jgi:hypothetical protein